MLSFVQQVAEIKERAARNKESPTAPPELADKAPMSPVDYKAGLRKVSAKEEANEIILKTQLKRIDPSTVKKDESGTIVDFKSRLRKVEIEKKNEDGAEETGNLNNGQEEEDKRKSTGSINSLKKLWENKDGVEGPAQVSPKLGHKLPKSEEKEASPPDKKSWPPSGVQEDKDKPTVPAKPLVKSSKPAVPPPAKPQVPSNIYATPGRTDQNTEGTTVKNKESVLEISQALEISLGALKTGGSTTTAGWLQLSDKVGLLHSTCQGYVDSLGPPQARFKFRELLVRLENQARQLRSAGTRNSADNAHLCTEVQNTVKDVVNAVSR